MLEEGEEEPLDVTIEEEKLEELAQQVAQRMDEIKAKIDEREAELITNYGLLSGKEFDKEKSRWFLPGNKTLLLMVRFFTKCTGNFAT